MAKCCSSASCGCKIEAGSGIVVTGLGSTANPYEIATIIPDPPESGTYVLQSVDGVLEWVAP